ncbi:phosphoribosyltransferase [Chryseotalea sanaruensis]|uniref:Phosphoribosyltransferase n=1 Tax=Chryseotalea sanaruensis TaxID=2482724 RepID=A0A401U677_9BACT|nr:phosphoribosyltransferase family protein [Chryseotalea sanaruensis]GCC50362.1 phosphoribosyltransferase [Chryseotalea sanaruensis]
MFTDRKDAGLQLAHALDKYRHKKVLVLGIPRGGIVPAYYVALHLSAEFSTIVVRKLGHPDNPEAAFGAIAEDGSIYLSAASSDSISDSTKTMIIEEQQAEIKRRVRILRKGKALPELKGKTIILVDDGIATGATLFAAIAMCKKQNPLKIIVAAAVASQSMEAEISKLVDEVIILEKPFSFYAVGQGYKHFQNMSDEETLSYIDAWESRSIKKFDV